MAIGYRDFLPGILKKTFFKTDYETLPAVVGRANAWIAESAVRVVHVETVLLPNIEKSPDTSHGCIRTSGEMSSFWFQVVRVWHEQ